MLLNYFIPDAAKEADRIELALIFASSLLLGIWAARDTIALRNILLVLGAFLSIFYIFRQMHDESLSIKLTIFSCLPLIMLFFMFVWVVAHYLFLSIYPHQQLKELTSTWLRCALAVFLGFGTALSVKKNPRLIHWLWAGIFLSFVSLYWVYLPKILHTKKLYAMDWYGGTYFFNGKINAVLVGNILIAGLLGTVCQCKEEISKRVLIYSILGVLLTAYSFVFIFDTRNGVGLACILIIAAFLYLSITNFKWNNIIKLRVCIQSNFLIILCLFSCVMYLGFQHAQYNKDWSRLIDDIQVAIKIDEFQNWKNPIKLGYPYLSDGRQTAGSTYERVAWATAGILIFSPENKFGVGILEGSFPQLLYQKYGQWVQDVIPSTHSAWVDLLLSYGYPGLFFLFGALVSIMIYSLITKDEGRFKGLVFIISFSLLTIYSVGELIVGHGMEILIYWIAFLGGLNLIDNSYDSL